MGFDVNLTTILVTVIGSGGLIGSVVAYFKLRPEIGQIVVTAAQGALIVQTGVIESLREELTRHRARLVALEIENEECRKRLADIELAVSSNKEK